MLTIIIIIIIGTHCAYMHELCHAEDGMVFAKNNMSLWQDKKFMCCVGGRVCYPRLANVGSH